MPNDIPYKAGYFMGYRDGKNMRKPQSVAHTTKRFQTGYSDGYHKGTGGLIL